MISTITPPANFPTAPGPHMPLSMAGLGQTVIIQQIHGGRRLRQRLQELGLHPGGKIRIVSNEYPGPMIVAVKEDGRLALGRSMCHHILVTPATDERDSQRQQ